MRLALVKNGVPFDAAFAMPEHMAMGMVVAFGEMEGSHEFNWDRASWEKKGGR